MTNDQLKTVGEGINQIGTGLTTVLGVARGLPDADKYEMRTIVNLCEIILKANQMLLGSVKDFIIDKG